ncbi:hypothetical protein N7490_005675 [Penicillium lividum]|nr:hypothetical protein N7490_005675 [Penicillium lividum]
MESPEHSQTTTIQKNSEATILDQSQLQRLVAIDQPVTLKIKFNWGWFKSLPFSQKQLVYNSAPTNNVIGTGALHVVNIDADYEYRGRKVTLVAQKRFRTLYTHRFGLLKTPPPKGQSAVMTWTGDVGASMWDFVCTDEQHMPISKFAARLWGMKKIGQIELMSPLSHEEVLRNEMLITVMTLAYCMVVRIFSLLGSIFGDPGHDKKYKPKPLPVDNGRASSDSIPQLSTAVTDGQADLTHQQPHSDPYVETATGTANQSAVK